jgi:hypothetical protein
MKALHVIIILMLCIFFQTCKDSSTYPSQQAVQLSVEDVGVTDAYLHLQVPSLKGRLTLERDGATVFDKMVSTLDTFVVDDTLLPKRTYSYRAKLAGEYLYATPEVVATTMDTTSHEITWAIDTMGDGNSSSIYDVDIVSDTCIWIVGDINYMDSLGQWSPLYNAAKWDGKNWQLRRIPFAVDHGTAAFVESTFIIRCVYALSPNDIWLSNGAVTRLVGDTIQMLKFLLSDGPGRVNRMWGTSPSSMYFAADNGRLTEWYGRGWQKIESGTSLDIKDIWGSKNTHTGEWEIMAAAGNYYVSRQRMILRIRDINVSALSDSGINWALNSLWFVSGKQYWVVGDGMWQKRFTMGAAYWKDLDQSVTDYVTNQVRGTDVNDVFLCGAYGEILHFNGMTWKSYRNVTGLSYGQYQSIAVKGNTVVAVGYNEDRAVVARGRR